MTHTSLEDYYQERISELDEELERLRETINQLTMDLADATGLNDQLERDLNSIARVSKAVIDYCHTHPEEIKDIPDEVWVPFTEAVEPFELRISDSKAALKQVAPSNKPLSS